MKVGKFNVRLRFVTGSIAFFFFLFGIFFTQIKNKFEKYQRLLIRDKEIIKQQSFKACSNEQKCYQWDLLTNLTNTNHIEGRDGAGLLSFHDTLWLLGGWNPTTRNKEFVNATTNQILFSTDGMKWDSVIIPIPWEQRHTAGYIVFKNKMWVIGGDANQYHYQNDVWNSSDGRKWTKVTDSIPWGDRVLHYSFILKGKMWILGGQSLSDFVVIPNRPFITKDTVFTDVWNSEDGDKWKRVTDILPFAPRGGIVGSVVFNDKVWIIGGGKYHEERRDDIWASKDGLSWEFIGRTPWQARYYHNIFVFDDKIWMFGGNNFKVDLNDCWYSENGVQWHELKNMNIKPRHASSIAQFKNQLYIMGGSNVDSLDIWKISSLNN